jgi:hypothetical protein
MDYAENTIPLLLFMGHYVATAFVLAAYFTVIA